jgi:hypothetical protein
MKAVRWILVGVTAVGLLVDAYVHWTLASGYDGVRATVSQGQLFRVEAVMALIAAVVLVVRPGRWTALFAALVAGGGLVALLMYAYVDIGQIGPMPNMYEPNWYTEKVVTAVAQAIATATALTLVVIGWPSRARVDSPASVDAPVVG